MVMATYNLLLYCAGRRVWAEIDWGGYICCEFRSEEKSVEFAEAAIIILK